MDEIYDVLDQHGKPVSKATWSQVHKEGLLHTVVGIIVFKDESKREILLQKRSAKVKHFPSLIDCMAGGHVLAGDTPEQGARKELQEELFHDLALPHEELAVVGHHWHKDMPNNIEFFFVYTFVYPGPFSHSPSELAKKPWWMPFDDMLHDMCVNPNKYSPSSHLAIRAYVDALAGKQRESYEYPKDVFSALDL